MGLGRTTLGTRGSRCEILAAQHAKARSNAELSSKDCMQVDTCGYGNMIFGQICPHEKMVREDDYNAMKREAVQSPAHVQKAMESFVNDGVDIKQPDTVTLLADMLYGMLRLDVEKRMSTEEALSHSFTSLRILTPEDYAASRNGGIIFPGGSGPVGSPWKKIVFQTWIVKHVPGMGLGGFAAADIPLSNDPIALYCALDWRKDTGECDYDWQPSRCTVSIDVAGNRRAVGELPIASLKERQSPGVFFNAANRSRSNNLV